MTQQVINGKSLARLAAVQLIFQYEARGKIQSFAQLVSQIGSYYSSFKFGDPFYRTKAKLHSSLFKLLVSTAQQMEYSLNSTVELLLPGELDLLKTSIVKVGIAELSCNERAPSIVVVNEYSNIASSLSVNPAVVNSILDRIAKCNAQALADVPIKEE